MYRKMSYVFIFVISLLLLIVLVSVYHKRVMSDLQAPPHSRTTSSANEIVDWTEIFNFVPNNVRYCSDLFQGDGNLTEKFQDAFAKYSEKLASVVPERMEGYTAQYTHAYKAYTHLASAPFLRTICETGFNAGHSTFGWLTANPLAKVYTFDIGLHNYSRRMAAHLQTLFPGRLHVTWGDSTLTIPQFRVEYPHVTCDLLIIDGGHSYDVCKADFENFFAVASRNNIVILDNYPQKSMMRKLGDVWESGKRTGTVSEIFNCNYENKAQPHNLFGCSVGKYIKK